MMTSQRQTYDAIISLAPAARNATANGTGVDLQASGGGAVVELIPGAWTDGTHAFKLQDSADNSTFTDVAASEVDGSFTSITAATTTVQRVAYLGSKRYIRVVATVTGATTGAIYGAIVSRSPGRVLPR